MEIRGTCIELFPIFFRWNIHFAIWFFFPLVRCVFFSLFLIRFVVTSLNTCFNSFKNATNENKIFFSCSFGSALVPSHSIPFFLTFSSFLVFFCYFSFSFLLIFRLAKIFSICSFYSLNTHALCVRFFLPLSTHRFVFIVGKKKRKYIECI